ncbi:hypothetical protein D9619_005724 [Psilocybe cf. subviscida]|uniref:PEBP-like protein n=1 Tax=Psilocybe cf. subviscida TaxID=2480587 RepID=A0A8H5BWU5_9AGAR|nr:hypothetical protein D9619_005724 [Psilocybe cf. subviscida]
MFSLSLVAAIALVPFAVAQQGALGIQAIEAHFLQSHIVPDLFQSFTPDALLTLNYAGVEVGPVPTVTVTPANSSVTLSGTYTLAMVDADIVGAKLPDGQTRHWLVNGVTVAGGVVKNDTAVGITNYAGPGPAAGSGPHRYVVALYEQPSTFKAPDAFSQPNMGVSTFDFNAYVKDSGLGPLVAATYITVEEGTSTASIQPTSAVITSTLPAAASPSSATGGSKATTATGSVTGSAGGAAPTSGAIGMTSALSGVVAAAGVILTAVMM